MKGRMPFCICPFLHSEAPTDATGTADFHPRLPTDVRPFGDKAEPVRAFGAETRVFY